MRWWLILLVGLGLIGAFASVALASAISSFIAGVTHAQAFNQTILLWFFIGMLLKIAQSYFQETIAAEVSSRVKTVFRGDLLSKDYAQGSRSAAEITLLATRGLDSLDAYFGKFLPQFIYTIVVTPIMVVLFFVIDPISGLILVFTIPLIPLFMVFIGLATKKEQDRQFEALSKLGKHFAEVVKGISTLKLFGRIKHQLGVLDELGDLLRFRTMRVLRVSFLSGFALELAASLSVALIAVTIGFRLIDGEIPFSVAMFLLILAPEAYLPIRMIGANYHASTEGIAAASQVIDVIESQPTNASKRELPSKGLELWIGPSGSGKSLKMMELVGGNNTSQVAWMPQQPGLFSGTVLLNITGGEPLNQAALTYAVNVSAIKDISLDALVDDFGRGLSGGQAQRVSLARAIYRLKSKKLSYLLLDEPTSSIDKDTSKHIWAHLSKIAKSGISVTAITHQLEFLELANRVVRIEN
ncbi:MAG: transporter, ATP-binding protein [Actinomycetota bacterium]